MKKLMIVLFSAVLLYSCGNNEVKKDYNVSINGTQVGANNADVKLIKYEGTKPVTVDSTTIKEGHFTIGTKVEKPELMYLRVVGIPSDLPLILEKDENIKIDINAEHLRKSAVVSKGLNKKFYEYLDQVMEYRKREDRLGKLFQAAKQKGTQKEQEDILQKYYGIEDEKHDYEYKFIADNKENLVGALVFEAISFDKSEPNYNKLLKIYETFSDDTKKISNVSNAYKMVKSKAVTSEGSVAPDFKAPTPEGKMLSLKDAMGKVTVIDFWASWCRPCRAENPFVVEIYKKYHPKGLNIIGVSLDKPDNKEAWVKAIKDDHLTWYHVSNLKYWNDPIARELYHVESIPQTFILDKNGVIRAKNLRRGKLEAKIKELLEE